MVQELVDAGRLTPEEASVAVVGGPGIVPNGLVLGAGMDLANVVDAAAIRPLRSA